MPDVGTKNFQNQAVRITDLAVVSPVLSGYRFHNCSIHGPAVLVLQGDVVMSGCGWDAPGLDAIFWEIPPEREWIVGAISLTDTQFVDCSFQGIGIGGPPETRNQLAEGFGEE